MSAKPLFLLNFILVYFVKVSANDLDEIHQCVGSMNVEQRILECQLSGGRKVTVYIASSRRELGKDSQCIQLAMGKAKILAGSSEAGHSVDSSYRKVAHQGRNSLNHSVFQSVQSELSTEISGFYEVFRLIQNDNCFAGVSRDLSDLALDLASSTQSKLIIKGRPPFIDIVRQFPQVASTEGAAVVRLPDNSYLVVASGMADGASSEVKSFRIAETRARANLGRLFFQEKVYEYTYSETTMHMKNDTNGTIVQVKPQQIFSSFVGFSLNLDRLQPVHCHWYDLKEPEQRWALVGFHVSKSGELIPHNQPWGL